MQDLRFALRWLARSPGFALTAILSLGLGIGFNTAIFAVVDALLLRPLPVREPARLVDLYTSGADGDTFSTSSLLDLLDYRAQTSVFEDVVGYSPMFAGVTHGDRGRLVLGEVVTGNYFATLGVSAKIGRTLLPSDDVEGAARAIVLSNRYWQREFGGQPSAIGRQVRIRGQQFTIVGVLDDEFTGMVPMLGPEIWVPTRYAADIEPVGINESVPSPTGTSLLDRRGQRWLFAKARLKPGVTVAEARANVDVIAARLRETYVATNKGRRTTIRAASDTRLHPEADRVLSWVVSGTMLGAALVLAIACANVAGMLLARASSRHREIGIRLAVGASRGRLVRQLLTESLVLAGLGAALGIVLAWWLTGVLTTLNLPIPVALSLSLRLDVRVLGFAVIVALATGVLAGLAPALRATRPDLAADLKGESGHERVAGRRRSFRDVLVVAQIAVTIVLLVCAGLLLRSLSASNRADVGFRTDGLAIVSGDTDMLRYSPARSQQYWSDVTRRIEALPGVQGVALASRLPFSLNFNSTQIAVAGHQQADAPGAPINSAIVSPSYFRALGVGVLQGRAFATTDTPATRAVAMVSESFVRKYWPGSSAIGQIVYERTLTSGRTFEIVGVVADHTQQRVGEPVRPTIFFSSTQRPSGYNVIVARTAGDDRALVAQMRETLLALEPDLLLLESQTMRMQMQAMLFPVRAAATFVAVFSGLGLLLAGVGLYGIIAFTVTQRTREIGIRIAIGATPRTVIALVVRQGLGLVVAGTIAGAVLAALATRVVAGALYGVGVGDPVAWSLAGLALAAAALAAHAVPAWRAARVDPVRALRT